LRARAIAACLKKPAVSAADLREKTSCKRSVSGLQSPPEMEADLMARQSTAAVLD
jgi:hypothetical protein